MGKSILLSFSWLLNCKLARRLPRQAGNVLICLENRFSYNAGNDRTLTSSRTVTMLTLIIAIFATVQDATDARSLAGSGRRF
jgi:hypothetical protein